MYSAQIAFGNIWSHIICKTRAGLCYIRHRINMLHSIKFLFWIRLEKPKTVLGAQKWRIVVRDSCFFNGFGELLALRHFLNSGWWTAGIRIRNRRLRFLFLHQIFRFPLTGGLCSKFFSFTWIFFCFWYFKQYSMVCSLCDQWQVLLFRGWEKESYVVFSQKIIK